MDSPKVKISMRTVLQRLRRRLLAGGEVLHRTRGYQQQLGDWYTVDPVQNMVIQTDVSPLDSARELGLIKSYEEVIDA